jgi:Putative Actinobacterial Holin-X, holin superfamily III
MSTAQDTHAEAHRSSGLGGRSLGELLSLLGRDAGTLLRQQVALAKLEMSTRGKGMAIGVALLLVGAGIGLFAAATFTAFAIIGLATLMATWLAALIVAALYGLVALVLALAGLSKLRRSGPNPLQDTIESVKEDVEWIKGQEISGRTSG